MSIKGFPSSQKAALGTGITNEFVTVQPTDEYRYALDGLRFAFAVNGAPLTAGAGTGTVNGITIVEDTGTSAKKGDFIRFLSGANEFLEVAIVKVDGDDLTLGAVVPSIAPGDTFNIMRYATQRVDSNGQQLISFTPIKYDLDGVDTEVSLDTVTPANSTPLPVSPIDTNGVRIDPATEQTVSSISSDTSSISSSVSTIDSTTQSIDGKLPAALGQAVMNDSLAVVIASNQSDLPVMLQGFVDAGNSSIVALGIGGVFTGAAIDITDYATVQVSVATDVASASNGLSVQYSSDGTNWDHKHEFTVPAPGISYSLPAEMQFMRIVYTNGAVAQSYMRLETILKTTFVPPSEYVVSQAVTDYQLASVTKSVIYGKTTGGGGGYVAVKVNPSGALTVDATVSDITAIVGQKTMANSIPVAIASDQSAVPSSQSGTWDINNISGAISLPTGAATEATSLAISGKLPATLGQKAMANSLAIAIASDQSAIPASQSGVWNISTVATISNPVVVTGTFWQATQPISAVSLPLPTNASTSAPEGSVAAGTAGTKSLLTGAVYSSTSPTVTNGQQVALQVDAKGDLKTILSDGTSNVAIKAASTAAAAADPALVVSLSPNSATPAAGGRAKVNQIYLDYSSSNVTTAAYTQILASSAAAANLVEIFDSSGELMILAVGGAGSEVDQCYIMPGGNGPVQLLIPASSRLSVKAKTATASAGFLAINLYS